MGDEPLPTRWTFEDFKLYYDVRFGRKKEPKEEVTDSRSNVDRSHANGVINANGSAMNSSELAVYEQFEQQVDFVVPRLDFF